jgi:Fe-S-cluster containining protein
MEQDRRIMMRERVCTGDANCCKKLYLILQLADIERICRHTGLHPKRFVRLYMPGEFHVTEKLEEEATVQLRCGPRTMGTRRRKDICIFLERNRCKVYPFKPLHCDLYPVNFGYPAGRTVIKHHREKFCRARFGGLIPAKPYLDGADRCNREHRRTQRLVDRWNTLSEGKGTAEQFFDFLAEHIRSRPQRGVRRR